MHSQAMTHNDSQLKHNEPCSVHCVSKQSLPPMLRYDVTIMSRSHSNNEADIKFVVFVLCVLICQTTVASN